MADDFITKKIVELKQWEAANPLRQWRKRSSIQKQHVAKLLGVSEVTVGNWESGRKRPSPDRVRALTKLTRRNDIAKTWEQWECQRPQPL